MGGGEHMTEQQKGSDYLKLPEISEQDFFAHTMLTIIIVPGRQINTFRALCI